MSGSLLTAAMEAADRFISIVKEIKGSFGFLKSMPQFALVKMQLVLKEIDNTVRAVDQAIIGFLEIAFDVEAIETTPKVLIDLGSTKLKTLIEDKRGHCSTIGSIRWRYLNGWLDQQRKNHEAESMKIDAIFDELQEADNDLFVKLAQVADYMESKGQDAIKEWLGGNLENAKELVKNTAFELLTLQDQLQKAQMEVIGAKNMFIEQMKVEQTANS